jgi:DNA-directed RNA polymerase subunit omega
MARFTVDDCMEKIPNRFDLTYFSAIRAREIEKSGTTLLKDEEGDKAAVLALREFSSGLINVSTYKQ